MSFENSAQKLAQEIRDAGHGFTSLSRDRLRTAFGIGKLNENQSQLIVQALEHCQILISPHPYAAPNMMRAYDLNHDLGRAADAVLRPDEVTDAPLRKAADALNRCRQDDEMRSEDIPWIEAFDILLQVVLGHGIDGWEDVRSGRHGRLLAVELASVLGFSEDPCEDDWFVALAAAIQELRPSLKSPPIQAPSHGVDAGLLKLAEDLRNQLQQHQRRSVAEHRDALASAARLALGGGELPRVQVEVGLLGLRRRKSVE